MPSVRVVEKSSIAQAGADTSTKTSDNAGGSLSTAGIVAARPRFISLSPIALGEADEAFPPDDDVIEHRNPHQLADVAQAAGQLDVRARRRGIAGRMVVTKDHCGDALPDQRTEHVARVDLDAGQRSAREAGLALNAMANVEPDRPELLH